MNHCRVEIPNESQQVLLVGVSDGKLTACTVTDQDGNNIICNLHSEQVGNQYYNLAHNTSKIGRTLTSFERQWGEVFGLEPGKQYTITCTAEPDEQNSQPKYSVYLVTANQNDYQLKTEEKEPYLTWPQYVSYDLVSDGTNPDGKTKYVEIRKVAITDSCTLTLPNSENNNSDTKYIVSYDVRYSYPVQTSYAPVKCNGYTNTLLTAEYLANHQDEFGYEFTDKDSESTIYYIGINIEGATPFEGTLPDPEPGPGPGPEPEPEPDIPDPLAPPTDYMLQPSDDVPDPITYPPSAWYHAEDLGQTHTTPTPDLDYIDFWFNGQNAHSFGLYRVSDGNRYNEYLASSINDVTIDIPGRDGQLWFTSRYQPRKFSISYAFDNLRDSDIRAIKRWLNKDAYGELVFTETPALAYSVKVTGQPTFNFIPFNTWDRNGEQNRYRGEGKIEFTAYYPFAHTPRAYNGYGGDNGMMNSWQAYYWHQEPNITIPDLKAQHYACYSLGLPASSQGYFQSSETDPWFFLRNFGDLDMPITLNLNPSASITNLTIRDDNDNLVNQLVILPHTEELIWDSGTGLIYGIDTHKVYNGLCVRGNTIMAIPPRDKHDYYSFRFTPGTVHTSSSEWRFWYY